jgi:hypothetical protein
MDMGTDGLFKEARYKEFFRAENDAAYRTDAAAVSFKAVHTAGNMHHAVKAAHGRKRRGLNPLALCQLCAADGAGAGIAGNTGAFGFGAAASAPPRGHGRPTRNGKKQGKPKIQQNNADKG